MCVHKFLFCWWTWKSSFNVSCALKEYSTIIYCEFRAAVVQKTINLILTFMIKITYIYQNIKWLKPWWERYTLPYRCNNLPRSAHTTQRFTVSTIKIFFEKLIILVSFYAWFPVFICRYICIYYFARCHLNKLKKWLSWWQRNILKAMSSLGHFGDKFFSYFFHISMNIFFSLVTFLQFCFRVLLKRL